MSKIRDSLKRLIGRIDKVKLVRELLLVLLVLYFIFVSKYFNELQSLSQITDFNYLVQNSILLWVIVLPFIGLILVILGAHWIDNWEDKKADRQHKEVLEALNNLTNQIKFDREDRNKPKIP